MVSGSSAVSNSFVSPYNDSFVSQSGWWCPALRLSPIHLSPHIAIHLSPSLAGGVRLSRLSPIHLSPHITIHLSPSLAGGVRLFGCLQFICLITIHLSPSLAGGVWLSGCLQLICLPYSNSFVSHSGWWCRLSACFQFICLPL